MSNTKPKWHVPPYRTYPLSRLPQISLLSATPMPRPIVEKPPSSFIPVNTATALATVRADKGITTIPKRSSKQFWYRYL